MHNRDNKTYSHLIEEMISDLEESVAIAKERGVKDEQIIMIPASVLEKHWRTTTSCCVIWKKLYNIFLIHYCWRRRENRSFQKCSIYRHKRATMQPAR